MKYDKTQFAEVFDAGSSEYGFERPDFDDGNWDFAKFRTNADYTMSKQPTKQLDIYDVRPQILNKTENGYFIDC